MKKLLIEQQVAALLEVSVKTLQGWRLKGGGPPFVKMGRLIRYAESDLEAFVYKRLRTSTSDRGQTAVYSPRPGITVRPLTEHERRLDRPPAAAWIPPRPPCPAPGSPTWRRHDVAFIRTRRRIVLLNQPVDGSTPRRAR